MISKLTEEFDKLFNIPDPPHGYLLIGVFKSADWIKTLENDEQDEILSYILSYFDWMSKKDLLREEEGKLVKLIYVLQHIANEKSMHVLNKIIIKISEIKSERLNYINSNAIDAKKRIYSK